MSINSLLKKLVIDDEFKEKINFIRNVSLFSGLSRKALSMVLGISYERNYSINEVIFEEGKVGKALYIVKSGEVAILKGEKKLATLNEGDFLGEMALLEEVPRSAKAIAFSDCKLILIYKVKFDGLLESDPSVGVKVLKNLSKILCTRLRSTSEGFAEVLDPKKKI
ncbi:MAG: cyclic nucleotide-binding domain-containing protein [Endomicrobiales bacterium]|nr:cyclic nucleotide-binding domain-containing protein [Endomicrobiales bacterium]